MTKKKMSKEAARRIQSAADRSGKNQGFKARATMGFVAQPSWITTYFEEKGLRQVFRPKDAHGVSSTISSILFLHLLAIAINRSQHLEGLGIVLEQTHHQLQYRK